MLRFLYFLLFVCAVSAIPAPNIVRNSERLARNLPPLPPRSFHALPGRSAEPATPVLAAKRSSASATPVTFSGRIEVRNGNSVLGFVENSSPFEGQVTSVTGSELHVTIQTTSHGKTPFDIIADNPLWMGPAFLGAGSAKSSLALGTGSATAVSFVSVAQTPPDSPPVLGSGGVKSESSIWSINHHTQEIKPHWVNPDGTKPATVIAYDGKVLFFVGDLTAHNKAFSDEPAVAVKFFLVP